MSMTKDQIKSAALALDPNERQALVEELWLSLDGPDQSAIDAAWLDEVRRRDAALAAGGMTTSPVDEAVARVLSRGRP